VVWWGTTAKRGCYPASHVYSIKIWKNISSVFILKQTIVECKFFFCILENNDGFYFVLENNCGYVSYLFYFAVIIIVRKVEMYVIYLPSYNRGLMD
jgi:hypothetical protein